jgi:hypothetical protein
MDAVAGGCFAAAVGDDAGAGCAFGAADCAGALRSGDFGDACAGASGTVDLASAMFTARA